jgi:hypothetical protein
MERSWTDHLAALAIAVVAGVVLYFLFQHRPHADRPAPVPAPAPAPAPRPAPVEKRQLVFVGGPSCAWCAKMERTTLRSPAVVERIARDYTFVKTSGRDATARYGVTVLPTYLVVDGERGEVRRGTGYRNAAEFLAWLDAEQRTDDAPGVSRVED